MFIYTLAIFAITAVAGLILAFHVLRNKFAPWVLSLVHGLFGAVGLVLLGAALISGSPPQQILIGFVLLLIAALVGFFLFSFHIRKTMPPKAVVIVHAGFAVVGFLTLFSLVL